jgi:hypothetical protein
VPQLKRWWSRFRGRQNPGFWKIDYSDALRISNAAGKSHHPHDHVDGEAVSFLPDDLDRFVQQQILQHPVDVARRKRNIEGDGCLFPSDVEVGNLRARLLNIDLRHLGLLGIGVTDLLLELLTPVPKVYGNHNEHDRHNDEKNPACLHIDLSVSTYRFILEGRKSSAVR